MKPADRRRFIFASAISLIALPVVWSVRSDDATGTNLAAATPGGGLAASTATADTKVELTPPTRPDYMEIETVSSGQARAINTAPAKSRNSVIVSASFRRLRGVPRRSCETTAAPFGALLTVRNVDNNRTLRCTNVSSASPQPASIVLDLADFQIIADLVESPISVEISW